MNQSRANGKAVRRPSKTRWFNVQTEPPLRPGVYERYCIGYEQSVRFPSDDWLNTCKYCKWRGLTKQERGRRKAFHQRQRERA